MRNLGEKLYRMAKAGLTNKQGEKLVQGCEEGWYVDTGLGNVYYDVCGTFLREEGMAGCRAQADIIIGA